MQRVKSHETMREKSKNLVSNRHPQVILEITLELGSEQWIMENDKEDCIIEIDEINAKKHCLLNHNMVLFQFSSFLACEKHSMRKVFQNCWQKSLKYTVFIFGIFKHQIFRRFYFCKSTQKMRNRKNFYTQKFLRLR